MDQNAGHENMSFEFEGSESISRHTLQKKQTPRLIRLLCEKGIAKNEVQAGQIVVGAAIAIIAVSAIIAVTSFGREEPDYENLIEIPV